jgi:hypothetical protein
MGLIKNHITWGAASRVAQGTMTPGSQASSVGRQREWAEQGRVELSRQKCSDLGQTLQIVKKRCLHPIPRIAFVNLSVDMFESSFFLSLFAAQEAPARRSKGKDKAGRSGRTAAARQGRTNNAQTARREGKGGRWRGEGGGGREGAQQIRRLRLGGGGGTPLLASAWPSSAKQAGSQLTDSLPDWISIQTPCPRTG